MRCLAPIRNAARLALVLLPLLAPTVFAQTTLQIHDIMTALPNSPYLGQSVSVSGIVVGVMNTGGFYFSEPSTSWDSLVATAEGMPVFYASAADNPSCAVVGNIVTVVGTVTNTTALTAADTPGTGITPTSCTVTGTGTMTQSINLSSVLTTFGDALKYTGMAASNTSFYAIAPTTGTLTETSETVTSNGQFWATLGANTTTNNHLFRTAGIAADEYKPTTAPSTVATWSGNPQRILIDTTTFGGSPVDITVGQAITCTVPSGITLGATTGIGLIDYTRGYSRLLIFKSTTCSVTGTIAPTTSAAADSTHFHVGTLDLNRFYSPTGPVAVTAAAYQTRLTKAALAIVDSLGSPDILSLQEVQDLATLTDLATAVNTLAGTTYVPYLTPGPDTSSLNLGFLVNSKTVVTDSVKQLEASATYTNSTGTAVLWERPPLVLNAEFVRTGKNYPVSVFNVHLTPRDNIGDATLGPDIRLHRAAQAADLSSLVQTYQTAGSNVVVAGNFNAFQFNDGYVDVLGVVTGSPAAASAVTLYQATSTTAALTNFTTQVASTSQYNYIERGNAESIEHILASATVPDTSTASASLASYVSAVTQPHFTADFAATNANSPTTPAGLTPHDGFVTAFLIPPVPTTASISATAVNFGSVNLGSSATQTLTITNTTTFTSTVNVTNVAISGTNATDFTQTNTCAALTEGATCTVTLTFTPTALGARTGLLTVTTDSTSNPTLTATLTGTGTTALAISPTALSFGNVDLGTTSAAQTVTLTNYTSVAIPLSSIAITGDFAETTTCGTSLPALGTCTFAVTFTPTVTGARTGTLTINNAVTVSLTGNGVDFTIAFSPTTGATVAGESVTPNLVLTPIAGYSANVALTCTDAASGSTCTPATGTAALSTANTLAVAITTTAQYTVIGYTGATPVLWIVLLTTLSGAILFFSIRRTRHLPKLAALVIILSLISLPITGCSDKLPSTNANPTLPGSYTYTISATDGTLTHTATYTLTVTAK
ncbi:choice-of-anchor D domain-containing protein [Granulicella sibirica]|uniref:Multicopper oxidase, type 2 n=1 Tax=Granulicella sibirica TaxID=2479048 RepID=A0A4Q0T0Q3_9BACT|nr:choice-of-anchor D domain-containing protein [Granulicella sibirica]RXH55910.1 multicopper oxidase, type 2 [Granulicella sibirica]